MSAHKKEILLVDVTRGDCLEANRKAGKSNTGTYFLSSLKDYDNFEMFFDENNTYAFDLTLIQEYGILFSNLFKETVKKYNGKGEKFDSYINYLLSLGYNPKVNIMLRTNDSRVFLRFKDNSNVVVNAFRNLLYEDLSFIVIEKRKEIYYIYPIINHSKLITLKKQSNDDFIIDE